MDELESLHTREPLPQRIQRHDFDRLIMLSDGVFSIAMTLLVLDVKPANGAGTLLSRLGLPLAAFALSFAVAAVFWLSHKRLFARLRAVDVRLTAIILVLLGLVALLPEATSLIYQSNVSIEASLCYVSLIALIGVVQGAAWGYSALVPKLMDAGYPLSARWLAAGSSAMIPLLGSAIGLSASAARSPAVTAVAAGAVVLLVTIRRRLGRRFG